MPSPLVAKEAVGEARGLRHVHVVEAVAVDVADRDAVVSHAARHEDGVEVRRPVVEPWDELPAKRGVARRRPLGHIGEDGRGGAAAQMIDAHPLGDSPGPSGAARQRICQWPSRSARQPALGRAGEVEAHGRPRRGSRRALHFDGGDQELGGLDRSKSLDERRQLFAERRAIEDGLRRHARGDRKISSCGLLPIDDSSLPASGGRP